jgi:hypothetical protein
MDKPIVIFLIGYTFTSLAHFVHTAEHLHAYPNMPAWLTAGQIYTAWLVVLVIGVAGFLLYRSERHRDAGLIVIAIYGLLGLHGLANYWLAPFGEHTTHMNFTILLDAFAGVALALHAVSLLKDPPPTAKKPRAR